MFNILTSKPAQALGTAFGILTGVGTVLSWFTPEWFGQLTLSEAIIVGLGFALGASLLLAVALAIFAWGFRRLKPLQSEPDLPVLDHPAQAYDDSQIRNELHAIRVKQKAIIEDYQRMLGVESRMDEALAKLDGKIEKLGELNNTNLAYTRTQIGSLYEALLAIYYRERLRELTAEIQAKAAILERPTTEKAMYDTEAWEAWEELEGEWRLALSGWIEIAEAYRRGTAIAVNHTPEKAYKMGWSVADAQFPNSTAIYAYKTFRIRLQNWREAREGVEAALQKVACEGTANSQPITNALMNYFPEQQA